MDGENARVGDELSALQTYSSIEPRPISSPGLISSACFKPLRF
jgi:hypothetical protein